MSESTYRAKCFHNEIVFERGKKTSKFFSELVHQPSNLPYYGNKQRLRVEGVENWKRKRMIKHPEGKTQKERKIWGKGIKECYAKGDVWRLELVCRNECNLKNVYVRTLLTIFKHIHNIFARRQRYTNYLWKPSQCLISNSRNIT
ncbi:unnamed protein product [Wuchereria bancrofti]|uniref:Uncharacterized protein n=1 Tax=Wuchereria bancrofti TaxID=6293 RepID=A0A3P7E2H7_WUCBA|nr:unnamed protein product [Wuchereria bancrofti]